jgi:hypothetical protein
MERIAAEVGAVGTAFDLIEGAHRASLAACPTAAGDLGRATHACAAISHSAHTVRATSFGAAVAPSAGCAFTGGVGRPADITRASFAPHPQPGRAGRGAGTNGIAVAAAKLQKSQTNQHGSRCE